jgi:hypothetical protein
MIMSCEVFAEWLRRQGHHVIRTASSYWYDQGPRVYQAFPYHWLIEPNDEELQSLLHKHQAIGLRYSTPLSAPRGRLSYHVVYSGSSYDLDCIPRRARQTIRKGLEYGSVEQIPLARLAEEGWKLRVETLARQGRGRAENQAWWRRLCTTAEDLPGFEAWGFLHEGQLTASILAYTGDDCCAFLYNQTGTEYLKHGVNHTLYYLLINDLLQRKCISQVFAGLHSLDASPDVDEYKFRLGFSAKPVRQRVVFNSYISPLINRFSYGAVNRLAEWDRSNPILAKAKGLLSFYMLDRVPLSMQPCPEHLEEQLEKCGSAN